MNWKKTIRRGLLWAAISQLAIAGKPAAAGLSLPANLSLENSRLESSSLKSFLLQNSSPENPPLESSSQESSSLQSAPRAATPARRRPPVRGRGARLLSGGSTTYRLGLRQERQRIL